MAHTNSHDQERVSPTAQWRFDRNSSVDWVSERFSDLFTDHGASIHGACTFFPSWLGLVHPDDMGEARKLLSALEGDSTEGQDREAVIRMRTGVVGEGPEATYGWFRVFGRRPSDGSETHGTITSLAGSAAEISCLFDRVHRLEAMLATVPECFKVIDRDCNLVEMNQTGLELVEADNIDQVRGVCVLELLLPEYHESFRKGIADAFAGKRVIQQFEIEGLRGTRRWMEQVAVRLPGTANDRGPEYVGAFTRDITLTRNLISDLSVSRLQAEQASESKTLFLANMSHEIRTPMTAILGFVDVLACSETPDSMRDECLATIRRNGEHLLQLINDILDHTKIESGGMSVELSRVSPRGMVDEVIELLGEQVSRKGLCVGTRCEDSVPDTVRTDPVRLRQILINLVGNAIKFTDTGRVDVNISTSHSASGQRLSISVEDTGIGIPESVIPGLFSPFTQADPSMSRRRSGTGLGLCISRSMAQLLGGDITVKSVSGHGSVFTLHLADSASQTTDATGPRADLASGPGSAEHETRALTGRKVLLVEDGEDNQRLITHHLSTLQGADVTLARNGLESIEIFRRAHEAGRPFELVLMDMQMPEMDGFTATRLIKREGCQTPIIALTANAMAGDRERCIESGCDDFVSKPIDFQALFGICASWISRARRSSAA